jgi:hypothetical protein
VLPCFPAFPGATLGSFLIALLHFVMELALFQTMSIKFALQPMIVAGAPRSAATGSPCVAAHARHISKEAAGLASSCALQASDTMCLLESYSGISRKPCSSCLCVAANLPRSMPPPPAGISSLWMALGWNYYTAYAERAEPTMSEDITVTQKDE